MAMSENSIKVLDYLKANEGRQMTYTDIAEGVGIGGRQALGCINGLVRKNLATREPVETTVEVEGKDGEMKQKAKTINYIHVTDAGKVFDPAAVEAE